MRSPSSPMNPSLLASACSGSPRPIEIGTATRSPSSPMNPLLLASACSGSRRALGFLLSREDEEGLAPHSLVPTQEFLDLLQGDPSSTTLVASKLQGASSHDVEEGADHQTTRPAAPLLDGVTIDGDTALHVLATCGDGDGFLSSADVICRKARRILVLQNKKGDTPLHCAARAGRPRMVSRLIVLAAGDDNENSSGDNKLLLKEAVRKENMRQETPLHDAVRLGSKHMVELLMAADPELASLPKGGPSPLYLAISLQRIDIAKSLYDLSDGNLSYSGPNKQNALHAAVLRGQDLTEMVMKWNIGLTTQGDENGSTPLHFATSALRPRGVRYWIHSSWILWFPWNRDVWDSDGNIQFNQVLEANLAPMYQADDKGLFPIHIAAQKGAAKAVISFLEKCRSIACLRDAKGRTFLHVAVEKNRWHVVSHVCKTASLSRILNMQDNDGNSGLHLAVKKEFKEILCLLLENPKTDLNITNNKGETPRDLAENKILDGYFYSWNPRFLINNALKYCDAKHGTCRRLDHFEEQYIRPLNETEEADKLKTATQTLGIAAVLMVTVAFGASFALPGGYNNGTPALSGRYVFDAFIVANSLGFGCAGLATIHLMYAGTSIVDIPLRIGHFNIALFFAHGSATSLGTAFVLGMYVTLAPVAYMPAVAICVVASIIALTGFMDLIRGYAVARALYARLGSNRTWVIIAHVIILQTVVVFWPLVLSFITAAISAKYRHK